ncbi:MAG: aldo/keto reductase [Candidatus Hydrogenedens sp.]|nr:aldo/keto reductase [Candidatus Hydrogenedens sp.]
MDYVRFGQTGLLVSPVALGTMTFGNEADEAVSRAIMDAAYERGVNFFDAAHNYNRGATEEIVGRWMGGKRSEIILTSKVFFPAGGGRNDEGCSRRNILRAVETSLRRLQTDYIDILFLHHWDANVPIEHSLSALHTLAEQGKIHYAAVSNFSAWQTMKAVAAARANGYPPIAAVQPMYSLVKRQVEVEILPLAAEEKLAVMPYNVLGAGLLTGKYLEGQQGRLTETEMYRQRYANDAYADITRRFVAYAREHGHEPAPLAAAWVMAHPLITSVILGARNLKQLNSSLGCLDIRLTPEQRAEITALSIDPPLATDREPMAAMQTRGW